MIVLLKVLLLIKVLLKVQLKVLLKVQWNILKGIEVALLLYHTIVVGPPYFVGWWCLHYDCLLLSCTCEERHAMCNIYPLVEVTLFKRLRWRRDWDWRFFLLLHGLSQGYSRKWVRYRWEYDEVILQYL